MAAAPSTLVGRRAERLRLLRAMAFIGAGAAFWMTAAHAPVVGAGNVTIVESYSGPCEQSVEEL